MNIPLNHLKFNVNEFKRLSLSIGIVVVLILLTFTHSKGQTDIYPPISGVPTKNVNLLSPDPIFNYHWSNPKATDGLESYRLSPKSWMTDQPASFHMKNYKNNATITVQGEGDIRFDFGCVSAGWLEFESTDLQGTVEMSISEYNQPPVYAENYPPKTLTPKKYGNTYRLELNPELYEGVRFGWIHVRSYKGPWHIKNLRLVCQIRPTNYNGSFSCSDPMLTKIWYTGAYTVKLNLLKDYYGAILMNRGDRISWTGDAYPAQAASMVAFGNYHLVKKNINHTSNQSNGIRSYALYWVLSLLDYYNYTGDTATLNTYIDNACAKLDDAYNVYGTNPSLVFFGWDERLGAGFEHPNIPEPQNAYKMVTIRVWKEFAMAMNTIDRQDLSEKYEGYADTKSRELKDGNFHNKFDLHAASDAVNTGYLSQTEKSTLYNTSFADRNNRISYSPFNQYFVIQALARMDKHEEALESVFDLWGGQIAYGGTTFFENYRPSWNAISGKNGPVPSNQCGFTSLCHPWGAGVTKWLSEEILGIKPTSPGFSTFEILPHLGRSLTNVSGSTPTPKGTISASFDIVTGKCQVSIPPAITGRIGLPKVEKQIKSVTINGKLIWNGVYHPVDWLKDVIDDNQFVYLDGIVPGNYDITITYKGRSPKNSATAVKFKAAYLSTDTTTSGNWGGIYGSDGYQLCNYNGNGKHSEQLPDYVTSIEHYKIFGNNKPLNTLWADKSNDKRALAPDAKNSFPRVASCIYAQDNDQIGYTFTSTINVKGIRGYKVSLYFLDWDNKGRKLAIEMFDAETSELITPVQEVEQCKNGAYLTFSYNRSVKFRINPIRGLTPVLSGIFFDH